MRHATHTKNLVSFPRYGGLHSAQPRSISPFASCKATIRLLNGCWYQVVSGRHCLSRPFQDPRGLECQVPVLIYNIKIGHYTDPGQDPHQHVICPGPHPTLVRAQAAPSHSPPRGRPPVELRCSWRQHMRVVNDGWGTKGRLLGGQHKQLVLGFRSRHSRL